jgi:hypothetical protein
MMVQCKKKLQHDAGEHSSITIVCGLNQSRLNVRKAFNKQALEWQAQGHSGVRVQAYIVLNVC